MNDEHGLEESRILALQEAIGKLEGRVSELEAVMAEAGLPVGQLGAMGVVATEGGGDRDLEPEPTLAEVAEAAGANIGPGLIGGILLALAGAFMLRSLTDGQVVPAVPGIALGLAYAGVWVVVAQLLGRFGRRGAASASGLAAALVALPMIWESTSRFKLMAPWVAGPLLIVVLLVLLALGGRHRLAPVSGVAVLGTGVVSLWLMFSTRHPEPFAVSLVILGTVSLWFGPRRGGPLPWFGYLFANLGLFMLFAWSLGEKAIAAPVPAVVILSGYCVASLVIIIVHSRKTGDAGPHEFMQGVVAVLLGYGGALAVSAERLPAAATLLGVLGVVVGAAGYSFLLMTFRWSRAHRWVFLLHSSLAVVLVAMGSWSLFEEPAWLFVGLAILLAVVGILMGRVSPGLHASMAILFAVAVGDLGVVIVHALGAPGSARWPEISPSAAATLAAAVCCCLLPLRENSPIWPAWLPRMGRGAVVLVMVLGLDSLVVQLAAPLLAGSPGSLDPGVLASLRTGVLAVSIVALAWISRYRNWWPAQRLVWPLLGLAAIKLLAEDFPRGRASTMAVGLLSYGVALIVAARLRRIARDKAAGGEGEASEPPADHSPPEETR